MAAAYRDRATALGIRKERWLRSDSSFSWLVIRAGAGTHGYPVLRLAGGRFMLSMAEGEAGRFRFERRFPANAANTAANPLIAKIVEFERQVGHLLAQ
jgi:hypothetical protein